MPKKPNKNTIKKTPPEELTIDEAASITLYTMEWKIHENSLYQVLNEVLRSENRKELPPWFLYLKLFLTGLSRLQSTRQFLYRGVKSDLHKRYPKNKNVIWWGFSSCTLKIDVLKSEPFLGTKGSRTLFNIECNSGKAIICFSEFPGEKEILLLPETQVETVGLLNQDNSLYIIQLKEIRSPFSISPPSSK
jgi:hypothetical protein